MKSYTICLLGLELRQTVVVGGGKVASRKVEGLLYAGAGVRVISPGWTPEIQIWADAAVIEILPRSYQDGDLEGAFLVIAATDDPVINERVWSEAVRRGCLVNVVDDPGHSTFSLPAVVRRGEMAIAISTGGSSPALARRLRERIEELIGPEYADLTSLLAELRPELIASFATGESRLQAALRVVDSDILNIIKNQGKDAALAYGRRILQQA